MSTKLMMSRRVYLCRRDPMDSIRESRSSTESASERRRGSYLHETLRGPSREERSMNVLSRSASGGRFGSRFSCR